LLSHRGTVEIGQERTLFRQQCFDAESEPFALQVCEVPHLFDRRERAFGSRTDGVLVVQCCKRSAQALRHLFERTHHPGSFLAAHFQKLHGSSTGADPSYAAACDCAAKRISAVSTSPSSSSIPRSRFT